MLRPFIGQTEHLNLQGYAVGKHDFFFFFGKTFCQI